MGFIFEDRLFYVISRKTPLIEHPISKFCFQIHLRDFEGYKLSKIFKIISIARFFFIKGNYYIFIWSGTCLSTISFHSQFLLCGIVSILKNLYFEDRVQLSLKLLQIFNFNVEISCKILHKYILILPFSIWACACWRVHEKFVECKLKKKKKNTTKESQICLLHILAVYHTV